MKKIAYFIIGIAAGAMFSLGGKTQAARPIQIQAAPDTLTDWQMLQLAIIMTESKGNPDARGAAQDMGLYQMRPIYISEVNRVSRSHFSNEDAFDPAKAVEMFNLLQMVYNPQKDTDRALYYHNKSKDYKNRVLRTLEIVQRYEAARKAVIENGNWER